MLKGTSRSSLSRDLSSFLSACLVLLFASVATAQVKPPPAADSHLVAPAALAKLLPTPEGWTGGDVQLSQVDISSACSYTFARVSYAKDELRVKVTLADTGAHPESLMALASLIAILPEDYDDKVPPATTIKRMKIEESQAAEMWDAEKTTGEITVVVGGRFVVAIEAQTASDLEALRAMLASVDLKALAALK